MRLRHSLPLAVALVCVCLTACAAAQAGFPAASDQPAMQLPPDQVAFRKANANVDRVERAAALQAFVKEFPKSKRVGRAHEIVLDLLLDEQPQDVAKVHAEAQAIVDRADKDSKANAENSVAYSLAEALPNGVDLAAAEAWARDAVNRTTLAATKADMKKSYASVKLPMPSDKQIEEAYAQTQAGNLQTLTDVYFHEGKLAEATQALGALRDLDGASGEFG